MLPTDLIMKFMELKGTYEHDSYVLLLIIILVYFLVAWFVCYLLKAILVSCTAKVQPNYMWRAIIGCQLNILKWSQYHMQKGLLDSFSSWFKWHLIMYFSFGLHLWPLCQCMIAFLPCKFQLHCLEKNGRQITKMVSYCAYHRYKIPL